jgi:hypothetical protein
MCLELSQQPDLNVEITKQGTGVFAMSSPSEAERTITTRVYVEI